LLEANDEAMSPKEEEVKMVEKEEEKEEGSPPSKPLPDEMAPIKEES
jgi:hypothetical protein